MPLDTMPPDKMLPDKMPLGHNATGQMASIGQNATDE